MPVSFDISHEEHYVNGEHTDSAALSSVRSPNKSPYDPYEFSDSYYRSPENRQNALFENVRQRIQALAAIKDVIPHYLLKGEYPEDGQRGEIYRYGKEIDHVIALSALYAHRYGADQIDPELSRELAGLQKLVNEFHTQMQQLIIFDREGRVVSAVPPFNAMAAENPHQYIRDLRAKYGPSFSLFTDIDDWNREKSNLRNIPERVLRVIKSQKSSEEQENNIKEKAEFESILTDTRELLQLNAIKFNPASTMKFLLGKGSKHIDDFVVQHQPDLMNQLEWLRETQNSLWASSKEYYLAHTDELCNLEFGSLMEIFRQFGARRDFEVESAFANSCTSEQFAGFLSKCEDYPSPPDITAHLFRETQPGRLTEKQQLAAEFALKSMKNIWKHMSENNLLNYLILQRYILKLKEVDPSRVSPEMDRVVDILPKSIQFMIHHIPQMRQYCGFLSNLYLEFVDKDDLKPETAKLAYEKLQTMDQRHPEVVEEIANLAYHFKERFEIPA